MISCCSSELCPPSLPPSVPPSLPPPSLPAWDPSLKVSCKGTVAIENLSGLDCNPEHDISCTVKIDSQFQVGLPVTRAGTLFPISITRSRPLLGGFRHVVTRFVVSSQDCTAVLSPEECASDGWQDEPVEFSAYNNMHCDIQVWAYRFALVNPLHTGPTVIVSLSTCDLVRWY